MATPMLSGQPAKKPPASAFWDCSFSADELVILGIGLAGAGVLHLEPVLNSGAAKPLLIVLGLICMLRPVTGFFFVGASSILPTASGEMYAQVALMNEEGENVAGMIDSGTQFAFFSWLAAFVLVYRKFEMKDLGLLLPMVPWLGWMTLTKGVGFLMDPELIKCLAFSVMGLQLARASNGRYLKCLVGLGIGLLMVSTGFWANAAGLPVQLMNWGGERGGFERIGGVVADSVMLWPPILTGVGALIGVAAFVQSRGRPGPTKWTKVLAFGGFFVSLVPLISAMTNSAVLGMAIILGAYGVSSFGFGRNVRRKNASSAGPMVLFVGIGAIAAIVIATDAFESRRKLEALWENYEEQSGELGATASRNEVWDCSMDTISRYPLFGYIFSGGVEKMPDAYRAKGYYLSHNVFLDYGRAGGIPAMVFLAYFFFMPMIVALKTGRAFQFLPFMLAMLAQLIFFTSLSFWTYKPFWAYWVLFMMAASEVAGRIKDVQAHRLGKKWHALGVVESPLRSRAPV
jgi:hypothetical protein